MFTVVFFVAYTEVQNSFQCGTYHFLGTQSELFPAVMFLYSRFSSGQQPSKSVLLTNLVSLVVAGAFWRSLWIPMSLMRGGECGY